jgi:parallel beta-helix repeat protein
VQNTGGQAITAQAFVAAARDPANANVDFPGTGAVTLQPGQQYSYSASRSFATAGPYSGFPGYFDGTNWFQLAAPTSFTVVTGTGGDCTLPWGGTVPNGGTVTAYQSSSVTCGNSCTSETRTCTNGTLSGSYTNSSCTPPTGCTTLTVAQDGSGQYSTISAAAAAAQPGYEILIKAGTYNEQVTPSVSGTESANITFRAAQSGTAVITYGSGPCINLSGVSYLNFTGLKLDNCNAVYPTYPANGGALQVSGDPRGPAHHIVADGLTITSSTGSGVYIVGFGWATVHDIIVRNSAISNSAYHGVFIYRAVDHITVDSNKIFHSGNDNLNVAGTAFGIEIRTEHQDNNLVPDYIFITNNEVGYSMGQGARTWDVRHVLFKDNYSHHNGWTGINIEKDTHFSIFDGNRVEYNSWTGAAGSETGMWIDQSTDCVLRNNRSKSNNIGIWVGAQNNRVIARNNVSYLNDGSKTNDFPQGMRVNGDPNPMKGPSSNVMLVHNTMYKNGNGTATSYNLLLAAPGANNVTRNNIAADAVSGTNVSADSSYTISNNCYSGTATVSAPSDTNSITQDPQFVNADAGDFHLQATSGCIDRGAFLAATTAAGSGTSVTVTDGRYFSDGYGITEGDLIMIGTNTVRVTQVSGNTLTLDRGINWSAGDPVSYPYTGSAPDIGAFEYP